jgi:phospholipase/carboxylesterase
MHERKVITGGKSLDDADKALILIHGRGASARDILGLAYNLNVEDYALIAPQATNSTWYPYSFLAEPPNNEPWLSSALSLIDEIINELNESGIPDEHIFFAGFSQGACLALEYVTRNARKWGGVAAFTGGLIGDKIYQANYNGDFQQTPVFIGSSNPDAHVPVVRVQQTTELMKSLNAQVTERIYPNIGHTIIDDEIREANRLVFK